jgi:hypothetical protein
VLLWFSYVFLYSGKKHFFADTCIFHIADTLTLYSMDTAFISCATSVAPGHPARLGSLIRSALVVSDSLHYF